jgi:hypothetical protein
LVNPPERGKRYFSKVRIDPWRSANRRKYEHEMAIALRSVLDMEEDDIAALLKEKMPG